MDAIHLAIEAVQAAALLVLVYLNSRKRAEVPREPAADPPRISPSPPLSVRTCEVLRQEEGHWRHHGFVRRDSPAWREAYDTPGFALREGDQIEPGVQ